MADEKPTYEHLQFMVESRDRDLRTLREQLKQADADRRMLRFALRGMTHEHLHLRVNLSPDIITKDAFELAQTLVEHHAKRAAYEIEERIGKPSVRLRDALLHINYLENHATARGLPFKPFGLHEQDRELMDFY